MLSHIQRDTKKKSQTFNYCIFFLGLFCIHAPCLRNFYFFFVPKWTELCVVNLIQFVVVFFSIFRTAYCDTFMNASIICLCVNWGLTEEKKIMPNIQLMWNFCEWTKKRITPTTKNKLFTKVVRKKWAQNSVMQTQQQHTTKEIKVVLSAKKKITQKSVELIHTLCAITVYIIQVFPVQYQRYWQLSTK